MKRTVLHLLWLCLFLLSPWRGKAAEEQFAFQPEVRGGAGEELYLLQKQNFTIGYSFRHRQPIWVGYYLSSQEVEAEPFKRPNRFAADPMVPVHPVQPREYSKSGFDRGHMVPAADMAFAMIPLKESFLMSNITPQLPGCNRGVWKRLETKVRAYARQEGRICIITGPVFAASRGALKNSGITIPSAFYKVLLDMTPPQKMIAFLIPHESSRAPLSCFVVTVDEVEALTGLDFFASLDDESENEWESHSDFRQWEPDAIPRNDGSRR